MVKGKLRHIAISVPDKEKAAKFYEETFGFERGWRRGFRTE
jgi:catechol 2,3-dioxygenase-like lactoylglutathione lyase family enzyme